MAVSNLRASMQCTVRAYVPVRACEFTQTVGLIFPPLEDDEDDDNGCHDGSHDREDDANDGARR